MSEDPNDIEDAPDHDCSGAPCEEHEATGDEDLPAADGGVGE